MVITNYINYISSDLQQPVSNIGARTVFVVVCSKLTAFEFARITVNLDCIQLNSEHVCSCMDIFYWTFAINPTGFTLALEL